MSSVDPLAALNEKMDTLIKIQAALAVKGMATQREKITFFVWRWPRAELHCQPAWDDTQDRERRNGQA
jgi:hypothetical protein